MMNYITQFWAHGTNDNGRPIRRDTLTMLNLAYFLTGDRCQVLAFFAPETA